MLLVGTFCCIVVQYNTWWKMAPKCIWARGSRPTNFGSLRQKLHFLLCKASRLTSRQIVCRVHLILLSLCIRAPYFVGKIKLIPFGLGTKRPTLKLTAHFKEEMIQEWFVKQQFKASHDYHLQTMNRVDDEAATINFSCITNQSGKSNTTNNSLILCKNQKWELLNLWT